MTRATATHLKQQINKPFNNHTVSEGFLDKGMSDKKKIRVDSQISNISFNVGTRKLEARLAYLKKGDSPVFFSSLNWSSDLMLGFLQWIPLQTTRHL